MDDERGGVPVGDAVDTAADSSIDGAARVVGGSSPVGRDADAAGSAMSAGEPGSSADDLDDIDGNVVDEAPGRTREAVSVGAAAGSARAAARRAGARTGTTAVKGEVTPTRDADRPRRDTLFTNPRRYLREVVAELRKVVWPARNQMVTYTVVVIVFVVFMVALVAGLDLLFAKGVLAVFKH